MNLYEINAALMQAYDDAVDQETGEITRKNPAGKHERREAA